MLAAAGADEDVQQLVHRGKVQLAPAPAAAAPRCFRRLLRHVLAPNEQRPVGIAAASHERWLVLLVLLLLLLPRARAC